MKNTLLIIILSIILLECCKPSKKKIDNAVVLNNNETDSSFLRKWQQSNIASVDKLIEGKKIERDSRLYIEGLKKDIKEYSNYNEENGRLLLYNKWLKNNIDSLGYKNKEHIYILERTYSGDIMRNIINIEHNDKLLELDDITFIYDTKPNIVNSNKKYLQRLYYISKDLKYRKYKKEDFCKNRQEQFLNITKIEGNKITSNIITYYSKEQCIEIDKILSQIDNILNIKYIIH